MTPTHDTAAALEAAIDAFVCVVRADSGSHAEFSSAVAARDWLDRAITAHVEAEVARRLAAAPDVEDAIRDYGFAASSRSGTGEERDALRAAIAADKARAVAGATDGAVRAERFADTVCSLVGARDHGRGGQTVDAGTARLYADAVVRIGAIIARDKARPTPDEARRLVAEYTEGIIDYTLSGTTVVAAGHGTAVTGTIGPDPRITSIATARTALLRALGVEA